VSRHPQVAGLHYVHGAVLYHTGQFPRALEVVEAALGADPEMFEDLHLAVQAKLCAPRVERARQCLRSGDPKTAIEHLAACGDMLSSDTRYEWLWSYAHERYAKSSKVPFVGWRRTRRAGVPPLNPAELQEVLGWVLAEEFNAGLTAMDNQDFTGTSTHCARAEAIDPRCGAVAYLHATAETFAAEVALERIDLGTLAVAERHLTRAAALVPKLAADPDLTEQRRWLESRITTELADIARLTRFIRCVIRFNDLMTRYQHRTITTRNELYSVRGELISIRSDARISRKEHASDAAALRTLDSLLAAVDHNLRQLLV
jgi:tetratricopeptide (TPR) repeat protein